MSDIEKYINEHGKECYRGVTAETPFSPDLFHMPEKQFEDERQWAFHSELGSLTVVDRMTGFGWRDVESGYRDKDGKFWLASGNYDVRGIGCKTVGEAIQWLKERANTCDPDYKPEPEPEDAKDTRIAELESNLAAAEADAARHVEVANEYMRDAEWLKVSEHEPPYGEHILIALQLAGGDWFICYGFVQSDWSLWSVDDDSIGYDLDDDAYWKRIKPPIDAARSAK